MSQKKPKAKNVRNILAAPLSIQWSDGNPECVAALQKVLEELLPLAKLENKSLKLISKEAEGKNHPEKPILKKHNNVFRSYLTPGFQSVTRGLEKGELSCVMMAGDISPPMIPRVICSYCHSNNVPLMVVPQLKHITKTTLGFSTMALGLKKIADTPNNQFYPIYQIISQNPSVLTTPFDKSKSEQLVNKKQEESTVVKNKAPVFCDPSTKPKVLYLYRDKGSERVFRPGMGTNGEKIIKVSDTSKDVMDADFIGFSKSESKISKHSSVNVFKTSEKGNINDDDSDCDSLDEDNIFFVDNNPDQMLLDTEPMNDEDMESQTAVAPDDKLFKNKGIKKSKTTNERYFSGEVKQKGNHKKKSKEKKSFKEKVEGSKPDQIEKRKLPISHSFKPLTIKTVVSNPKKIRRKKK
ncbi:uncharacterized protein LOC128990197 [Macrosteles quadrilineatus]|uniref:uncharacterized protein LOC128990197 n=1 Tax=Macrosteles quadrilineatus TaxID=74068 RepID=UPI0023E0964A|nr:uncharacterized protein LOC128990197 [Macrosteles quadrilineatus]